MAKVTVGVGVDNAQFRSGLERMKQDAAKFASQIRGSFAGMISTAAIGAGVVKMLERSDEIMDMATRFRLTGEEVQRLGNVAERTGTSFNTVARAMTSMQAAGLEPSSFYAIADSVANATDKQEAYAEVVKLFGSRVASELLPMLSLGSEGIRAMGAETAVMGNETVEQLARAQDAIKKFKQNAITFFGNVVEKAIGPFVKSVQSMGAGFGVALYAMMEAGGEFSRVMGQIFSGDFGGAYESVKKLPETFKQVFTNSSDALRSEIESIWEPEKLAPIEPKIKPSLDAELMLEQMESAAKKMGDKLEDELRRTERFRRETEAKKLRAAGDTEGADAIEQQLAREDLVSRLMRDNSQLSAEEAGALADERLAAEAALAKREKIRPAPAAESMVEQPAFRAAAMSSLREIGGGGGIAQVADKAQSVRERMLELAREQKNLLEAIAKKEGGMLG